MSEWAGDGFVGPGMAREDSARRGTGSRGEGQRVAAGGSEWGLNVESMDQAGTRGGRRRGDVGGGQGREGAGEEARSSQRLTIASEQLVNN